MTKSDGSTALYYQLPYGATELQHLISKKNMNYCIGSIFALCYDYCRSHRDSVRLMKEILSHAECEVRRLQDLPNVQG